MKYNPLIYFLFSLDSLGYFAFFIKFVISADYACLLRPV